MKDRIRGFCPQVRPRPAMRDAARMRCRVFLLLGLLLLLPGLARPDTAPLWEVRGASNRIHILGSIHFLRPGDSLPPAVLAAYDNADVIVMEVDLDDLDPAATAAAITRLAFDPRGRTLDVLLGDRDYEAVAAKARALGLDPSALRPFEPWMAALTVTEMQLARLGFAADSGVEQQLLKLAVRDHKEVRGLETLDEQLSSLDELPAPVQRAFLMDALNEAATMKVEMNDIVTAWKAGDTRSMEQEFLREFKDEPELYRRIVVDRNSKWAEELRAMARDRQDYLVVVGTLHLVGPDSLIHMLARMGYPARQVQTAD